MEHTRTNVTEGTSKGKQQATPRHTLILGSRIVNSRLVASLVSIHDSRFNSHES